ncbi:MAG: acetylornithine transaminase [Alphaproteobacteria bacterium]|nr:acetylornithine transaminase [Alphaproteobacteria bacterium]|tara:strand:+ start:9190 stop:10371 length:1182 start_codon:yes stop_codon:yes gene_type:complete
MTTPLYQTYARYDIAFERGEGAYLFDTDGRQYLDFATGIAVNALGHAHPKMVEALKRQAERLWHVSNLYHIPEQERVAAKLTANSFADAVFFCNSGAEAVETGLKTVRRFHHEAGNPQRWRIVTVEGAFHGRTLAELAAGRQEKHMAGFGPIVDGFDQVPYGDLEAMKKAVTDETAAILVEPVQGEGGVHPMPPGYLKALRGIADAEGILLFYDEVQTGMGRTGKLFAHEWDDVPPDVMAVAKALAGGFPVGACLASAKVAGAMSAGSHGSTFGGNPLAMAVAESVLDTMLEEGFLDNVQRIAGLMNQRLGEIADAHPGVIEEVRGLGLLIGLKCVVPAGDVIDALREDGLLTVGAADNVVRFLPPIIIDESQVDSAVQILDGVCGRLGGSSA